MAESQKPDSIRIPFKGGAYEGRSKNINGQRSINMFRVRDKMEPKVTSAMYGTPGRTIFSSPATSAVVRGIHMMGVYIYAVVGSKIYRVNSSGTATEIDTMGTATGKVGMADNGTQVLIVDGSTAAYVATASTCTEIGPGDDYLGGVDCVFFDGYFVIALADGRIQISTLYNGLTWDANDDAYAESAPDGLVGIATTAQNLWLIGQVSTEVFYNSGNVDFPLERMPGAVKPIGCGAAESISEINGEIYWLSDRGVVVKNQGYDVVPVSEDGINYQIGQYTTKSDAVGWSYTLEGRSFYVLGFPTHNRTWVVDIGTKDWHEWRSGADDMYTGYTAINRGYWFYNKVIVGDSTNGKLYTLDMDTYTDGGELITRVRRAQTINKERVNVLFPRIELEFETGGGPIDTEPQADLKWSDDGAETWGKTRSVPIGSYRDFSARSVWRECGKSRNRIFELTVAENMKFVLIEAYCNLVACRA